MATRKQTEESFQKLQSLLWKVRKELLQAQRRGVVETLPGDKYRELSPFFTFYELVKRVENQFKDPIAKTVMADLTKKARGY